MIRPLAALAVAGALVAPQTADAVVYCQPVRFGARNLVTVCAGAGLNGDGDTVDPTVYWGCTISDSIACTGEPIEVGKTGIDDSGQIWVAGGTLTS